MSVLDSYIPTQQRVSRWAWVPEEPVPENASLAVDRSTPICLSFSAGISPIVRKRITYAFRVFAAIYNHKVVDFGSQADAVCLVYGNSVAHEQGPKAFHVPALYRIRDLRERPPALSKHRYASEDVWLFHGVDPATENPDWLGEIFEWISSSSELSATRRDSAGRICFSESVFRRQGISPRKPYSMMVMAWLKNSLENGRTKQAFAKAPSPVPGVEHAVICCHDIDFYYAGMRSALTRLIKNLGISYSLYRSWSFFSSNVANIAELLKGKRVGDYLPPLLMAGKKYGFQSTLFVVSQQRHWRDPNYRLEHLTRHLESALSQGFSIGLQGSYGSVVEALDLASEIPALEEAVGRKPRGSRQHWLRFDKHDKLFDAVEQARLIYDSSIGFSKTVGYRGGACFAFPPYNFRKEQPYEFLEIPLAIMDGGLIHESLSSGEPAGEIAEEVLRESRRLGWGGIATLWHNPIEPLQVPVEINNIFWECVKNQVRFQERWMTADEFVERAISRYQNAGLLQSVRFDA